MAASFHLGRGSGLSPFGGDDGPFLQGRGAPLFGILWRCGGLCLFGGGRLPPLRAWRNVGKGDCTRVEASRFDGEEEQCGGLSPPRCETLVCLPPA